MKAIIVETGYHRTTYYIRDDAKADAAYQKLKAALETYREFGNDTAKAVSIDTDSGQATFRLGAIGGLATVTVEAMDEANAATIHELKAWHARFKDEAPQ